MGKDFPTVKSSVPYFTIKFNSATLSVAAASQSSFQVGVETIPIPRIPEIPATYKQAIEVLGLDYVSYMPQFSHALNPLTPCCREIIWGFDIQQAISPSQVTALQNTLFINQTVGAASIPLDPSSPYVIKSERKAFSSLNTNNVVVAGGTTGISTDLLQQASGYVDLTAGGQRQGPLIIGSSLAVISWMASTSGHSESACTVFNQISARCRFITVSNNEFEYELLNLLQL